MIKITLSDGTIKEFFSLLTIKDVAKNINIFSKKVILGGIVNGLIYPVDYLISNDCNLELITNESEQILNIVNYTAGLITAKVLCSLYPNTIISSVFSDRDFFFVNFKSDINICEQDLEKIEECFWKLIKNNIDIYCCFHDNINDVKEIYKNNKYVITLLSNMKLINDVKKHYSYVIDKTYFYGSYVATSVKYIKKYKVLNVSEGVHWKSDSNNEMLQRLSGSASSLHASRKLFDTSNILDYGKNLDHRKIGKDLEIFTFDELVGPGLPIWLPNGVIIKREIQNYIRSKELEYGFVEVETPVVGTKRMYEISRTLRSL